jgi:hypothetical protein
VHTIEAIDFATILLTTSGGNEERSGGEGCVRFMNFMNWTVGRGGMGRGTEFTGEGGEIFG